MSTTTRTAEPIQKTAEKLFGIITGNGIPLERNLTEARQRLVDLAGSLDFDQDRDLFNAAAQLDDRIREMLAAIRRAEKAALRLSLGK